jgi:ATP-binding cassette subfamily B protein
MKAGRFSALSSPLTFLLTYLSIAVILFAGGQQVSSGTLTAGELIAFIGYLTQISLSLGVLANLIVLFTKASASSGRIMEALNAENTVIPPEHPADNTITPTPLIEFKDVSFRYIGTNSDAVSSVNFTLERGETLGIIGLTGSGKSTLVNLLPRFYDVTTGEILLDGINIKDTDMKKLRETIRMIPQQSSLFTGTVFDNLRVGCIDAEKEAAKIALDAACIGHIDLDTPVNAGGKNFSGGERARLCIARAIISKPAVLIADDSFSALDRKTEAKLRENLKTFLPETAFIVITERISAVQNADKILVLEDGKSVGYGTHSELLETNAVYRGIYDSQNED